MNPLPKAREGKLEGRAAMQRDLSKREEWASRNLTMLSNARLYTWDNLPCTWGCAAWGWLGSNSAGRDLDFPWIINMS